MIRRRLQAAHVDDRGSITDLLYKAAVDHITAIVSVAGAIRGNHYHVRTTQHTYVVSGSLEYHWRTPDGPDPSVHVETVGPGEFVTSPPGEVHAMRMLEPTVMLVFSEGPRGGQDYEADTVRVEPIVK
jgi:mannose-6-phosphate isomerase-like protein (cupin superfamily)